MTLPFLGLLVVSVTTTAMLPTPVASQRPKSPTESIRSVNSGSNGSATLVSSSQDSLTESPEKSDLPQCIHLEQLLANDAGIVKKFKAIISWKATAAYEVTQPAKRRKVRDVLSILNALMVANQSRFKRHPVECVP